MDSSNSLINIHSIIPSSKVNGPGRRMVIFFQGCSKKCHGCFNPETHPYENVRTFIPEVLFSEHLMPEIEGITVSGGEPFQQANGLFHLLKTAKEAYGLTTVVYTGFNYEEIKNSEECIQCFDFIDVLIDGRFEESKKEPTLLARGSTNQRFHFFTNFYQQKDFYMPAKAEITIGKNGEVTKTGFSRVAFQGI